MDDGIEAEIYEAGAVAEFWPRLIDKISDRIGTHGGLLFTVTASGPRWVTSEPITDTIAAYLARGRDLR